MGRQALSVEAQPITHQGLLSALHKPPPLVIIIPTQNRSAERNAYGLNKSQGSKDTEAFHKNPMF